MCQMDVVEKRQVTIDNRIRITDEMHRLHESTLYYVVELALAYKVVELNQITWCIGSAKVKECGIEDAKALARTEALRTAAVVDMVQSGMMCECRKHRIEYKSIPWGDSFLTGYAEMEYTLPHMLLPDYPEEDSNGRTA